MTVVYQIIEYPPEADKGYRGYGGIEAVWRCKDPEVMLSGPGETGKTRGWLEKLDACMWKYPGAQGAIVRKTRASMPGSVLQTFENKVLGPDTPVQKYGGNSVLWYDYPNGSRVWVAGMDNPNKALSSERDIIYINQAEELLLDDWEKLCTRATGRAGNMPYAQVGGDCNPDTQYHWIKQRAQSGRLTYFESRHEDNPTLFDPVTGEITDQGRRTMDVLDNLTGVRKKRLRYGLWVAAEGQVYEGWDPAIHLISNIPGHPDLTKDNLPKEWRRFRVVDFGYSNPFVCQWWAVDPDGRMYLYRELYGTQRLVEDWALDIVRLSKDEEIVTTIADHDAEDSATLRRHGVANRSAKKDVGTGIQAVQARLRVIGDGRPRLYVFRDALVQRDQALAEKRRPTCTSEEFSGYIWQPAADGKPVKEAPLKLDDHGMDAMRYMVMHLDLGNAVKYHKRHF